MTATFPGPTIEVCRGMPVEVAWENRIEGTLPVTVVRAPAYEADGVPVRCLPGRSGGHPDPAASALPGFSVVHVHGAVTHAASDGWTENLAVPGQQALDTYPNAQRAALLWYHDHVMGVTRLSVYAGLAGLWIVRDDRERELDLPEGPPYELPLLLTDRNFDTDADGSLTGELLHKTDPEVMECFSPFTAVNGAVLNGSNARTYRLVLTRRASGRWSARPRPPARRDREPDHGRITQIGTEGGLLLAPTPLPTQGLVLASAERADLLVDFSDLAPGTQLTLWNTAAAPFDGTFADPATAGTADLDELLPYPEVLRVRVIARRRRDSRPSPPVLATDFRRVTRDELDGVVLRAIALVERKPDVDGEPPMLTLRELVEDPDSDEDVISLIDPRLGGKSGGGHRVLMHQNWSPRRHTRRAHLTPDDINS